MQPCRRVLLLMVSMVLCGCGEDKAAKAPEQVHPRLGNPSADRSSADRPNADGNAKTSPKMTFAP